MTTWPCPPRPPHQAKVRSLAGLGFSVASNSSIEVELLPGARTPVPLPARLGDGQDSGEVKQCTAISRRLLHQMKVAVRAAKQDARIGPDTFGPGAVHDAYSKASANFALLSGITVHSRRGMAV